MILFSRISVLQLLLLSLFSLSVLRSQTVNTQFSFEKPVFNSFFEPTPARLIITNKSDTLAYGVPPQAYGVTVKMNFSDSTSIKSYVDFTLLSIELVGNEFAVGYKDTLLIYPDMLQLALEILKFKLGKPLYNNFSLDSLRAIIPNFFSFPIHMEFCFMDSLAIPVTVMPMNSTDINELIFLYYESLKDAKNMRKVDNLLIGYSIEHYGSAIDSLLSEKMLQGQSSVLNEIVSLDNMLFSKFKPGLSQVEMLDFRKVIQKKYKDAGIELNQRLASVKYDYTRALYNHHIKVCAYFEKLFDI
jgi:hypothetical protein